MPNSPVVEGQNANAGIRKLAINVSDVTDLTLAVGFKPIITGDEKPEDFPEELRR